MTNSYIPIPMRVIRIGVESPDKVLKTFDLAFEKPEDRFDFMPGQFCEFSLTGRGESPFGIASSPTEKDFLRFTINRTGSVTTEIHYLQEGDRVGIRGPLGNWYPVDNFKGQDVTIVGGGFAFTTLRSLLVYMLEHRNDYGKITVLYGARNPDLFLYKDELKTWAERLDMTLHLTIDRGVDGWDGHVGFVPAIAEKIDLDPESWVVVCGPPIMLRFTVPVLLKKVGFPPERIITSLERRMKCGIGKCGRCGIGSKYVCIDGPVFSYAELKEIPEAL